jgi:hypothetical protein
MAAVVRSRASIAGRARRADQRRIGVGAGAAAQDLARVARDRARLAGRRRRGVDDEARRHAVAHGVIEELARHEALAGLGRVLAHAGEVDRAGDQRAGRGVVGVAILDPRREHELGAALAQRADHRGDLRRHRRELGVGQAEVVAPRDPELGARGFGLPRALLGRAVAGLLAARQVDDRRSVAELGQPDHRPAAEQLDVVGVRAERGLDSVVGHAAPERPSNGRLRRAPLVPGDLAIRAASAAKTACAPARRLARASRAAGARHRPARRRRTARRSTRELADRALDRSAGRASRGRSPAAWASRPATTAAVFRIEQLRMTSALSSR